MVNFEIPELKNYRGNKSINGLYQFIINQIPPHKIYYEMFLGSGAILRHKRQAAITYGIDCNGSVIEAWKRSAPEWVTIRQGNALKVIPSISKNPPSVFVYLDPPYYYPSRRSSKAIYKCEFTEIEHEKLLSLILKVKFNCMISSYQNLLYSSYLSNWRKKEFTVCVHGKTVKEIIYMNYPEPTELHDYRYLGSDCWDRQRIKRKIQRRVDTLAKLPILEQKAIMQELNRTLTGPNRK